MWGEQPLSPPQSAKPSAEDGPGTLAATVGLGRDCNLFALAVPHPVFFPTWGRGLGWKTCLQDQPRFSLPSVLEEFLPLPLKSELKPCLFPEGITNNSPNFPKSYYFPLPGAVLCTYIIFIQVFFNVSKLFGYTPVPPILHSLTHTLTLAD